MHRRRFLSSAAALAGVGVATGLLPAAARAAAGPPGLARTQLLRLDAEQGCFRRAAFGSGAAGLRLEIEAFHPGPRSSLDVLRVDALFARGDAGHWRHQAWHYRRDDALGGSRAVGFDLGEGFRGLELQARTGATVESLGTCLDSRPWSTPPAGRYVLLLDAEAVTELAFSGDPRRPLGPQAPDHFGLRLVRSEPDPDLSVRADLACVHCAST